jgi:hypothetical protein
LSFKEKRLLQSRLSLFPFLLLIELSVAPNLSSILDHLCLQTMTNTMVDNSTVPSSPHGDSVRTDEASLVSTSRLDLLRARVQDSQQKLVQTKRALLEQQRLRRHSLSSHILKNLNVEGMGLEQQLSLGPHTSSEPNMEHMARLERSFSSGYTQDREKIREENKKLTEQIRLMYIDQEKMLTELSQAKTDLLLQQTKLGAVSTEPGEETSEQQKQHQQLQLRYWKELELVIPQLQQKISALQDEKAELAQSGSLAVQQLQREVDILKDENAEFASMGEVVVRKLQLKLSSSQIALSTQHQFIRNSEQRIQDLQQIVVSVQRTSEQKIKGNGQKTNPEITHLRAEVDQLAQELKVKHKRLDSSSNGLGGSDMVDAYNKWKVQVPLLRTELNRLNTALNQEIGSVNESPNTNDEANSDVENWNEQVLMLTLELRQLNLALQDSPLLPIQESDSNELDEEPELAVEETEEYNQSRFKPTGFRNRGWLPSLEEYTDMRIRITNDTTKRFKDLVVSISQDENIHDAVYNNTSVKSANVRKWPTELAHGVKNGTHEVKCNLLDKGGNNIDSFCVNDLTKLSTMDFFELTGRSQQLINVYLQCDKTIVAQNRELEMKMNDLESQNKNLLHSVSLMTNELAASVAKQAVLQAELEEMKNKMELNLSWK